MEWMKRLFVKKKPYDKTPSYRKIDEELEKLRQDGYTGNLLVYLGNGAQTSSGRCRWIFRLRGLRGTELESGNASGVYAVICFAPKRGRRRVAVNGFRHASAKFAGFYARKKVNGQWLFLTENLEWKPVSSCMPAKRMIQRGEPIDFLFDGSSDTVFLEAQWKEQDGETLIRCGYSMYRNKLMAHSFGAYQDHTYCNTYAAFENGVKNGYQYFEMDLSYTSDCRLVLCHGWTKGNCRSTGFVWSPDFDQMTYDRIMQMQVYGEPVIDAKTFFEKVKSLPYLFELDFHKVEGEEAADRIRALIQDTDYDHELLDRFMVQVYSEQMFFDIDAVYHFRHYQYLVGENVDCLDKIITFCLDHGICGVALRANLAKPAYVRKIKNAGLYILCYTVKKDAGYALKLLESGADTICTDYITPEQLAGSRNDFGKFPFYVYYNSGSPDVQEGYSELLAENRLKGVLKTLASGNREFRDKLRWINDGNRALTKNYFSLEGKKFAGWKLRIQVEEKWFWYCGDHCYHAYLDLERNPDLQCFLFQDESVLPVWTFRKKAKLIMVAVWEDT